MIGWLIDQLPQGKGKCYRSGERDAEDRGGGNGGGSGGTRQQRAPSPTPALSALAPLSPTRAATTGSSSSNKDNGEGGEGEEEMDAAMHARLRAGCAVGPQQDGQEEELGLLSLFRQHVQVSIFYSAADRRVDRSAPFLLSLTRLLLISQQALLELAWDGTSPVHNGRAREESRRFAR